MKSGNIVRVLLYIGSIVLIVLAAQWKKTDIIEKKNKVAVSLPNEYAKHGRPVDVELIREKEFNDFFRVSVSSFENSEAKVFLSRRETSRIKAGQEVFHPEKKAAVGRVRAVSREADLTTGLYIASISVTEELLGDSKSLDIVINKRKNSLSVPIEAVDTTIEGAEYHVWIVTPENKASSRAVKLGLQSTSRAEILDGLQPGDKVVVNGHKYLKENNDIRIRKCISCETQASEVAK